MNVERKHDLKYTFRAWSETRRVPKYTGRDDLLELREIPGQKVRPIQLANDLLAQLDALFGLNPRFRAAIRFHLAHHVHRY